MSIKKEIEKGKSYYEIIPTQLGGFILAVSNYGKVIFTQPVRSVFEAEMAVQKTFRGGLL